MTNLEGHFFQQYLTTEDKAKAEKQVVDKLRAEKRYEENEELMSKVVKELHRIFHTEYSSNLKVTIDSGAKGKVQFKFVMELSKAEKLGLSFVQLPKYPRSRSIHLQGHEVGWATFSLTDDGKRNSVEEFFIECHIADPDLDIKLKLIFDMAKILFELRPAIHT